MSTRTPAATLRRKVVYQLALRSYPVGAVELDSADGAQKDQAAERSFREVSCGPHGAWCYWGPEQDMLRGGKVCCRA